MARLLSIVGTLFLTVLSSLYLTPASAEQASWQSEDKAGLIAQCYQEAQARMVSQLSQQIQDALPEPAIQALLVANSQELAANCQCLFTRLTQTYSPTDFSQRPNQVMADAQVLSDEGGACASDTDAVLERTRQRLEDQLAGLTERGQGDE